MSHKTGKPQKLSNKGFWPSALEKVVKWGSLFGFFILPLVYFSGRVAPYLTSKEFFFMGLVDILLCAWIWLQIVDARYRLSKKNLVMLLPLFLFLVSMTISGIFGADPHTSFWSNLESGDGLIYLWHAFAFALIIASCIRVSGKKFFMAMLQGVLLSGFIIGIMTWFTNLSFDVGSKMLNDSVGGATLGNGLIAGAYFIFVLFLAVVLISYTEKMWKKIVYGVAAFSILLSPIIFNIGIWVGSVPLKTLVHTPYSVFGEARTAVLGIVFGTILSISIAVFLLAQKKWKSILGLLGIIIVFLGIGFIIQQITVPTSKIHGIFVEQAGARPVDWKEAVVGIKERPVLGWGHGNFQILYLKHLDSFVFTDANDNQIWNFHPHNATLEILVDGGILALVLYILVVAGIIGGLIFLYRKKRISAVVVACFSGLLFAYLLQNQMLFDSVTMHVMFFSLIAMIAGLADSPEQESFVVVNNGWGVYMGAIVISVLLIPVWIYCSFIPSRKVIEMSRVGADTSNDRITEYAHLFESPGSYIIKTDPEFYLLTLVQSYDQQKSYFYAHPSDAAIAEQEIASALVELDKMWARESTNYRLALAGLELENLQMNLLNAAPKENIDLATKYATRAFALSPTNLMTYWAYSETLYDKQDFKGAEAMLDQAIAIDPMIARSWANKITILRLVGTPSDVAAAINAAHKYLPDQKF